MPPHCDSLDGPVVTAARHALEAADVKLVLPFVPADGETEVIDAFRRATEVRSHDQGPAGELAARWFFENVVRIHRAGEGAPFTGLKPAGLDEGPVIPVAERAIESGSPDELADALTSVVREEVERRLAEVLELRAAAGNDVEPLRKYVEAMLDLQVWAHALDRAARGGGHHTHTHGEESAT